MRIFPTHPDDDDADDSLDELLSGASDEDEQLQRAVDRVLRDRPKAQSMASRRLFDRAAQFPGRPYTRPVSSR